jgi:hypothetical protein
MNRVTADQLSPWVLLLSGLSQTAIGAGLLLGQVATVVERRTLSVPQSADRTAVTYLRPVAALEEAA